MRSFIISGLPQGIEVDGEIIPIRTDFRVSMLFELLMRDPELTNEEKLEEALLLYLGEDQLKVLPADKLDQIINGLLWFYRCGTAEEGSRRGSDTNSLPPYSFELDTAFLYASFMEAYQIDLESVNMHWWKFWALFTNLPDSAPIKQAIYYRTCDIPNKASREEKERLNKLKNYYKLPVERLPETKEDQEINEILMNGGDLSAYLKKKGG